MMTHFCGDGTTQNLKDAGCDEMTIRAFQDNLQAGNQGKATQLLQKHRLDLLDHLHEQQKRIDCLDYLLFMIQRSTNNPVSI